jgi:hypothetical protein
VGAGEEKVRMVGWKLWDGVLWGGGEV